MSKPVVNRAGSFLRSNLLGLIALFIALSGVAVALPGKNKIDSGDIKQGQVRTLDLHRGAVTRAKLHRNAVDSSKVGRDSLTGEDVDETTLDFELGQGAIGEREEADRERRIAIPPAGLMPQSKSPAEEPSFFVNLGLQQASFAGDKDNEAAAIVEVPLDRAKSSNLQVRLLWDANGTGNVVWNVGFRAAAAGALLGGGVPEGSNALGTAAATNTISETTVLDIPAVSLQNGQPLALRVMRNGDAAGDTLVQAARLRLVEIRYTATG